MVFWQVVLCRKPWRYCCNKALSSARLLEKGVWMSIDHDALVYSTEHGDLRRRQPATAPALSLPPTQQTAFLQRASRGRGGKVVTLIKNLRLSPDDQKSLAKHLKQTCGTGGTIKDDVIEIQGDHRESLAAALQHLGYKTKLAGG